MPDRRFVLVTGASRGLGRSLALNLVQCGFSVFAGVRRAADGNDLLQSASGELRPLLLDVTCAEDIAAAEAEVRRVTGGSGLTGLVNNAGTFLIGPFEQTSIADVETLFRVNVLGLVAVTQSFLPLLRQVRGRIINISSVNGKVSIPFTSFYSASKFAVEALSDALRVELRPWGIEVSLVEPGVTRTDIRARGALRLAECHAALEPVERDLYGTTCTNLQALIPQIDQGSADPQHFLEAVQHALTAECPHTRYLAGPDTAQWLGMAALPDRDRDVAFAKMFAGQAGAV